MSNPEDNCCTQDATERIILSTDARTDATMRSGETNTDVRKAADITKSAENAMTRKRK